MTIIRFSTLSVLACASLTATLMLACGSDESNENENGGGGQGGADATGGQGGADASGGQRGADATGGQGNESSGGSGGTDEECERPYNGCAVRDLVTNFAGTYELEASVINTCASLGIFVNSDAVDVKATLDIDADTGVVRLEMEGSENFVEVDPEDEDYYPRDFSASTPNRWYAYAREWEVNGNGLSEGFNLYLNDSLEFSNVDQGGQEVAVRLYTQNGCVIDFTLVE